MVLIRLTLCIDNPVLKTLNTIVNVQSMFKIRLICCCYLIYLRDSLCSKSPSAPYRIMNEHCIVNSRLDSDLTCSLYTLTIAPCLLIGIRFNAYTLLLS